MSRLNWHERQLLRHVSIKLSDRAGDLPRALRLYDVELQDMQKSGSFGDIYKGIFRGRWVAMKCFRDYTTHDREYRIKLAKVNSNSVFRVLRVLTL